MILPDNKHFFNISLIGMAGVGKSTVGPLLAKCLEFDFLDTDDLIADTYNFSLQNIIDQLGQAAFQQVEEQVISSVNVREHVIATGGSAVYSEMAMAHLHGLGVVVWLDVPLRVLESRINNIESRGLVNPKGDSFASLYQQRYSLYRKFADCRIVCHNKQPDDVAALITRQLLCDRE